MLDEKIDVARCNCLKPSCSICGVRECVQCAYCGKGFLYVDWDKHDCPNSPEKLHAQINDLKVELAACRVDRVALAEPAMTHVREKALRLRRTVRTHLENNSNDRTVWQAGRRAMEE